jgi:hypothetical protein
MHEGAHPESDTSDLLSSEMSTQHRAIFGSLKWALILGRFVTIYATKTLARFAVAPRLGQEQRILGFLKKYPDHPILLNPNAIDLASAVVEYRECTGWREF